MRYHFFQNFDDYPGFKLKITPPKHFSWQCIQGRKLFMEVRYLGVTANSKVMIIKYYNTRL